LLLLLLPLFPSHAATYLTQDEALARAFPEAQVERIGHVLTDEQMAAAADLAGKPIPSALVAAYEARRGGKLIGTAYFDAHRVHSKQQTLMIVVGLDGQVADLQVLAFTEPAKYLAPEAWLRQFLGHPLDDRLQLKQDLQGITGATLTARATTKAVRRTLAIHAVLRDPPDTDHRSPVTGRPAP
jgi:Na+-translocating ferredoxin:NAD+ oxidoreductase RnfG subunit